MLTSDFIIQIWKFKRQMKDAQMAEIIYRKHEVITLKKKEIWRSGLETTKRSRLNFASSKFDTSIIISR